MPETAGHRTEREGAMATRRLTTYVEELIHRRGPRLQQPRKRRAAEPTLSAAVRAQGASHRDPTDYRRP
jgi:hypothetical protein